MAFGAHCAGKAAALRGGGGVRRVRAVTRADGAPLADLRVLDLADASGAYAGRLLAALGADVVLVEPPEGHASRPGAFSFYHAGKRSVVADHALAERLASAADVVVTTGAPAAVRDLAARHPHAVVASITPFGHAGPRADWSATDLVLQAIGGLAFVNGHPDGPPLAVLGAQAHHQAGIFAAVGALGELLGGPTGHRPRLVDVSIQAAVAASLEHVPGLYLGEGTIPRRQGTLHWTRAFRAGRCSDGWVLHSLMGDWTSLAAWVADEIGEAGAALLNARWQDDECRRAAAETIFAVLDRWSATRSVRHVVEGAQRRRLPYAALARLEDTTAHPQLRARGFFGMGGLPTPPFLLDDRRLDAASAAPALGEHQADVEREWLDAPRTAPAVGRDAGRRPLAGTRVLDFTWVVAGPVATRTLADLGARVVKIEHPETSLARDRRGGFFGTLNRGKESVVLDLRLDDQRRLARDLALGADVVADNFSARVMAQLGLDAGTLRAARPDLVCLGMTGYGATGPWRDRVSYGPTLQAEVGFTLGMPGPDGAPAGLGYSYSDLASGHLAALAVLATLWRRRRTGAGATIDFSQLEALAGLVDPSAAAPPDPAMPRGIYPAAGDDRWVAIEVRSDAEARRLRTETGGVDLADWTRERSPLDVAERLQRIGIAAGPVADARDLLDRDPQLAARRHVATLDTPEGKRVRLDGSPIRLSGAPTHPTGPGPTLGEHTRAVLEATAGNVQRKDSPAPPAC